MTKEQFEELELDDEEIAASDRALDRVYAEIEAEQQAELKSLKKDYSDKPAMVNEQDQVNESD